MSTSRPIWSWPSASSPARELPPRNHMPCLLQVCGKIHFAPLVMADIAHADIDILREHADRGSEPLPQALGFPHCLFQHRSVLLRSLSSKDIETDRFGIDSLNGQSFPDLRQSLAVEHHLHVVGVVSALAIDCHRHRSHCTLQQALHELAAEDIIAVYLNEFPFH